jgi:hypothetical protein
VARPLLVRQRSTYASSISPKVTLVPGLAFPAWISATNDSSSSAASPRPPWSLWATRTTLVRRWGPSSVSTHTRSLTLVELSQLMPPDPYSRLVTIREAYRILGHDWAISIEENEINAGQSVDRHNGGHMTAVSVS